MRGVGKRAKGQSKPRRRDQTSALPAKLIRPQLENAIPRTRLFRALDRLTRKPVTWVHAPAGAGKTTLLTTYLDERKAPVLWYDVDAGDADVSGLFHYTRLAAESLLGKRLALPVPRPGSPDAQRAFARRFFEALFAHLPAGTFLIFDNYQDAAATPVWNETFRELCAAITPRVRVLCASRTGPPAALARLAVSEGLGLLDWTGLRLDEKEVRGFLRREGRAQAGAADSARLLTLTDGWAVAVALLSKTDTTPARLLPRSEAKSAQARARRLEDNIASVFDFLAGEVLDRLDRPTRELLLQVALLPTFSAKMAEALTGSSDTIALLAQLHGEHLLIERQGERGFRLHDLFRMFLLERGRLAHGDGGWRALSIRAAELLADDDQFQPAADLLVAADGWAALADLIERQAPALAAHGRLATLGNALERIPPEHRDSRPWLLFWLAVSSLGRPGGRAQALAEQAFRDFRAAGDPAGTLLAWSLVVQTIVLAGDDFHQLEPWLRTLDELGLTAPAPAIATKLAMSQVLAYAFWEVGTPRSVEVADRALEVIRQHGTAEDRIMASGAALLLYAHGDHRARAEDMSRLARAEFKAAGADPLPKLAYLHSEAVLKFHDTSFQAALQAVEQGLALAHSSGIEVWTGSLMMLGVLSARARGDLDTAERFVEAMSPFAANGPSFARGQLAFGRACIAFERDELDVALRGIRECLRESTRLGFKFATCQGAAAEVSCQAARGDAVGLGEALAHLDVCLREADCPYLAAQANLVRVYARLCQGEDARDDLRRVFSRERQSGLSAGSFLGPRVMGKLLTSALEHDIEPELARKLLAAYAIRPGPEAMTIGAWPWPLKIRALGSLQIQVDGRPLRFGRKTPTVPLAVLKVLVAAGEPVSVARLTTAVWPGYRGDAPRGTLDSALHRLRKLLGVAAAIESDGSRVGLAPESCWTDTRAFQLTCDRIGGLAKAAAHVPSVATVDGCERALLDLYRGPFGAEDDPPSVTRAREQLGRRFARAVADLEELWRRVGERDRRDRLVDLARARDDRVPMVATV